MKNMSDTFKKAVGASSVVSAVTLAGLVFLTRSERSNCVENAKPSIVDYASKLLSPSWGHHKIDIGGESIIILDSHKNKNTLSSKCPVVMLHGFPDNALYFYRVAPLLVQGGYRVILPSLPGYDSSSVTATTKNKSIRMLASKIVLALQKVDLGSKFHLVGHDWGAIIADIIAIEHPTIVKTLTLEAVPHNVEFGFFRFPQQVFYSWYIAFFQLPFFPELWLSRFGGLRWIWNSWSPNLRLPKDDIFWQSVVATFKQPGVIGDALNYYRKMVGQGFLIIRILAPLVFFLAYAIGMLTKSQIQNAPIKDHEKKIFKKVKPIQVPVLGFSGEDDGCIMPELFQFLFSKNGNADSQFPKGYKFKKVIGAGHFCMLEKPYEISKMLLSWFGKDHEKKHFSKY